MRFQEDGRDHATISAVQILPDSLESPIVLFSSITLICHSDITHRPPCAQLLLRTRLARVLASARTLVVGTLALLTHVASTGARSAKE